MINVDAPTPPHLVGALDTAGRAYGVAWSGQHLFVADEDGGLIVFRARQRADLDADGDVDQADFARLQRCFRGAYVPQADPACAVARLDADDDVDDRDLRMMLACMRGSNIEPSPSCGPPE